MNYFQTLRINVRMMAGFAAVFVLMGIGSVVGLWHLNRLEGVVDRLATEETRKLSLAEHWLRGISVNLVRAQTSLLVVDEDALLRQLKKDMDATSRDISEYEKSIEDLVSAAQGKQILSRIGELRGKYRGTRAQFIERRGNGDDVRDDLRKTLNPLADAYLAAVQEFVDWQQVEVEAARRNATDATGRARIQIVAAVLCGLLFGVAIAFLLSRSIVGPLTRARDSARRIAGGDLSGNIHSEGRDEAAEMLDALAEMQRALRNIVGEVRIGAESVSTASTQISAGTIDLSSRTEQEASSIEETAASIEELTSTVNQNAEHAREADKLALSASEVANRGGRVMNQVVVTMENIQGSSKKIAEIIGVIDGIAFQTNILALNAAVEAARAGEQGRGFAVVASEVRNLAQRSASAAKEIKGLIGDSVGAVDNGSKLVDEAGKTMQEVVTSVKRVSDIIGEIATATHEQSLGISQVNTAVMELERVTQQNAALVEESAAASESLKQQATRLAETVAVFKVDEQARRELPAIPQPTRSKSPAGARRDSKWPVAARLAPAGAANGLVDEDWKEF
ncbi:MAG: MCP four helix bundle domain-containing protein [Betaproteobacteria bacterium]|nr:MCP four helix bundle domain-containing protein [Betaproteobacteria bacterium]